MTDRCETCDAYFAIDDARGTCRAAPPVAIGLGMEQVQVLGNKKGLRPIVGTYFPEVSKDLWCRGYGPKEEKLAFDPSKLKASGEVGQLAFLDGGHPELGKN